MKRLFYSVILIGFGVLVASCQIDVEEEGVTLTEEELYDIAYIYQAPETKKKQKLSEVIKIVFTKNNSSLTDTVAIDIEKKEIHIDPASSGEGIYAMLGTKQIEDAEKALKILEKYEVQKWKRDYTFEHWESYEDGYGWSLRLQFKDGAVETHEGSGALKSEIIPEKFDEFFEEIENFVEERLDEEDYEVMWTEEELKDIDFLFEAPKTTGDFNFKDVIKVVLRNQDHEEVHTIAIDIDSDEIYKDPYVGEPDFFAIDGTIEVDDTAKSLEILEKYNVQEWEEEYPNVEQEFEEGYSWNLWLQFEDATVKEYRGAGTDREEILPEDFDALLEELTIFVNERLEGQAD